MEDGLYRPNTDLEDDSRLIELDFTVVDVAECALLPFKWAEFSWEDRVDTL